MRPMTQLTIAACSLLLAACANEAVFADREYGMATKASFDRQIIHKDYVHAGKPVEGLAAIHAEPMMNTYQKTFSEGFTKEDIEISDVGMATE